MLKQIVEIAKRTPDTQHWVPTKEAYLIEKFLRANPEGFPKNLQVRVSLPKAQVGLQRRIVAALIVETEAGPLGRDVVASLGGLSLTKGR